MAIEDGGNKEDPAKESGKIAKALVKSLEFGSRITGYFR